MSDAKRILLIVDDDPTILRIYVRELSVYFDNIGTALSAEEAAQQVLQRRFTHLLSDLNLGFGENGFALVTRLRRAHPSIRRGVVITGESIVGVRPPPAVDRLIQKGGDIKELIDALTIEDPYR